MSGQSMKKKVKKNIQLIAAQKPCSHLATEERQLI